MNETTDLAGLFSSIPDAYKLNGLLALFLLQVLGRAWHAWKNGGGLRGIRNSFLFGTNTPAPTEAAAAGAKPLHLPVLAGLLLAAALASGCGSLDKSGAYAGDETLYRADLVIATSYESMHSFVLWEYQNREALAKWAEIRKAADFTRAGARDWISSAIALREAYRLAPGPDTRTALERALNLLREAMAQSTKYLTTYGTP